MMANGLDDEFVSGAGCAYVAKIPFCSIIDSYVLYPWHLPIAKLPPHRVSFVHSNSSALVFFAIKGADHLVCRVFIHFHPAVHFFHVNATKNVLVQFTYIEKELQKTSLIETVLCPKVHK